MTIPRGWVYSAETAAGGTAAQIVVPAPSANVQHVLTSIQAGVVIAGGGAGGYFPAVQILDGVTVTPFLWQHAMSLASPTTDDFVIEGEPVFIGSPGTAMTVRFTIAVPAGGRQELLIKGYII